MGNLEFRYFDQGIAHPYFQCWTDGTPVPPQEVEISKKDFEKGDVIVHEQTGQRFRVTSTSPFTIQRIP